MARSSALAVEGRGPALGKPRPLSLDQTLDRLHRNLRAHPCPTCMESADGWLKHLLLVTTLGCSLALSPVMSLRDRQIELSTVRGNLRRLLALLTVLEGVPTPALDALAYGALPGRDYLRILITDAFALGATLDRARAELRALKAAARSAALTTPAPAKRRVLPETT